MRRVLYYGFGLEFSGVGVRYKDDGNYGDGALGERSVRTVETIWERFLQRSSRQDILKQH